MSEVAAKAGGLFLKLEKNSVLASISSLQQNLSRLKPATSMVQDGAELEFDDMEGDFPVNNQSDKAAESGAASTHNQDSKMEVIYSMSPSTLAS